MAVDHAIAPVFLLETLASPNPSGRILRYLRSSVARSTAHNSSGTCPARNRSRHLGSTRALGSARYGLRRGVDSHSPAAGLGHCHISHGRIGARPLLLCTELGRLSTHCSFDRGLEQERVKVIWTARSSANGQSGPRLTARTGDRPRDELLGE